MIAALYVETGGCYYDLPDVDPWDKKRDARRYGGPWPVIAHPPCERWGKYATGSPCKKVYSLGDDEGCFSAALSAVERWGGVLEHPADSAAWRTFGLARPHKEGGWCRIREGWVCQVEQGHYGHKARKSTWLYVVSVKAPPELIWGSSGQRLPGKYLEAHGYKSASRCGMVAIMSHAQRQRTPLPFRDLLIGLAKLDWEIT